MIVFDITNEYAFDNIKTWVESIHERTAKMPFVLVGNKVDLSENRTVPYEVAEGLAK